MEKERQIAYDWARFRHYAPNLSKYINPLVEIIDEQKSEILALKQENERLKDTLAETNHNYDLAVEDNEMLRAERRWIPVTERELHAAWESQNKEIDRLNADLIDYPHLQKVVDGQMAQNQRLRRIIEKLKAEQGNGNEPLTLEELKQMDGEPVYCIDGQGNEMWCVVNTENEDCIDNESGAWQFCFYGMTGDAYRELHSMGWLGYRRKPEERKEE